MNTFQVLVLDDSRELIQKLGSRISHQHHIAGEDWQVVLNEIHVEIVRQDDKQTFSEETLRSVVEACRNKPNLILLDYGFISAEDVNLNPVEYFQRILTPADMIPALQDYLRRTHPKDREIVALIQSSFVANTCPIYLYTYTGAEFRGIPPIPDERAKLTQRAFQKNKVLLVDISQELFENDAFVVDKHSRAFLAGGLLSSIIERELLLHVLTRENKRLRFVRFYRSGAGVFVIVLLGGAIGAVGEWCGGRIMALVSAGFGTMALLLGSLAGILFFVLGLGIPLFFERLMSNLLTKLKYEEKRDG